MSFFEQYPVPAKSQPESEQELMRRAHALAGFTLGQLAGFAGWQAPKNLRKAKGWAGQLIEYYLGASAGSKQEQDFAHLGIELKTIPLNEHGQPAETTYVCIAPLTQLNGVTWEQSNVRNKLQRVLWIPVDGRREIAPAERTVGHPVLWSPNQVEDRLLRADWEELTEMIILGAVDQITARHGVAMQLRPKAANSHALTNAIGPEGELIQTLPRGYYLKKEFTHAVLQRALEDPNAFNR
ncbi:MAG: DNA mismatch repair endonuclease MutH [Idiomarina sp.]|nr:DNA mismatch repair endonuclease MutH [Idiomarina sp.]